MFLWVSVRGCKTGLLSEMVSESMENWRQSSGSLRSNRWERQTETKQRKAAVLSPPPPHPICSREIPTEHRFAPLPPPLHSVSHRPWNQMSLRTRESPPGSRGCYTPNWPASFLSLICWGTSRTWLCQCLHVSIQTAYRSFRGERHLHTSKHNKVPLTQGNCLANI